MSNVCLEVGRHDMSKISVLNIRWQQRQADCRSLLQNLADAAECTKATTSTVGGSYSENVTICHIHTYMHM